MSAIIYQRFHNYLEIHPKLPKLLWHVFRLSAFIIVGGIIWISYTKPYMGNILFWYILLPLAPLIFLIIPGFWRNICPAAVLNQIPKRLGFGLRLKLNPLFRKWYFTISIALLFGSIFYYPIFVDDKRTCHIDDDIVFLRDSPFWEESFLRARQAGVEHFARWLR